MTRRAKRAAAGLCCAGLLALCGGSLASAFTDTPRLPRPRPPVEAKPAGVGHWAAELGSHFHGAKAAHEDVPAVERTIPAGAATLPAAASPLAAIELVARLPHPRPRHPDALLAMTAPAAPAPLPAPPLAPRVPAPEDTACLARLDALGVVYTKEAPIAPDGLCWVDHPLNVTSLGSGVTIAPKAILNCRTAEALALWTRDVLIPEARDLLGATPTRIVHDSTYVCRTRNDEPGAKLSEHAHADAVDIAEIGFADHAPFHVADRDMTSTEGRFQVAIRGGSCSYFTTVLGPRSNAAHATHFHFDMARRRKGYRLCDLAETNFVGPSAPENAKRE